MNFQGRTLYREKDGMICGVCLGLARYFNIDATLVRILWLIACFCSPAIIVYIIAALIMPTRDTY